MADQGDACIELFESAGEEEPKSTEQVECIQHNTLLATGENNSTVSLRNHANGIVGGTISKNGSSSEELACPDEYASAYGATAEMTATEQHSSRPCEVTSQGSAVFSDECQICHSVYKEPMLLPCLHTFCKGCIASNKKVEVIESEKEKGEKIYFVCTICNLKVSLDSGEEDTVLSEDLLKNCLYERLIAQRRLDKQPPGCSICELNNIFENSTNVCFDCKDYLCGECAEKHKYSRFTIKHEVQDLNEENYQKMKDLLSPKQDSISFEISVPQERSDFRNLIHGFQERIRAIHEEMQSVEEHKNNLEELKAANIIQIQQEFNKLIERLKSEEALAIASLEADMKKYANKLQKRQNKSKLRSQKFEGFVNILEHFLQKSSDVEFMSSKNWYRKEMLKQVNGLKHIVKCKDAPSVQLQIDLLHKHLCDNKLFLIVPASQEQYSLDTMKFETTLKDLQEKKKQEENKLSQSYKAEHSSKQTFMENAENPEFFEKAQLFGISDSCKISKSRTTIHDLLSQLDNDQLSEGASTDRSDVKTPDIVQEGASVSDSNANATPTVSTEENVTKKKNRKRKKKKTTESLSASNQTGDSLDLKDSQKSEKEKSLNHVEAASASKTNPSLLKAGSSNMKKTGKEGDSGRNKPSQKSIQPSAKQKRPILQTPGALNQSGFPLYMQSFNAALPNKGGLLSANLMSSSFSGFGYTALPKPQPAPVFPCGNSTVQNPGRVYTSNDVWQPPPAIARPLNTSPEKIALTPLFRLDVWIKTDEQRPNITGLVCIGTGRIAVADYQNNKIKLFSSTGQFMQAFDANRPTSLVFCAGKLVWCSGNTLEMVVIEKNSKEPGIPLSNKDLPHPLAKGSVTEMFVGNGNSILVYEWIKKEKNWKITGEIAPKGGKKNKGPGTIMTIARITSTNGFVVSDWQKGAIFFMNSEGKITGTYTEPVKPQLGNPSFIPTGLYHDSDRNKLFALDHKSNRLLMLRPDTCNLQQEWSTLPAIRSPLAIAGNKDRQLFLTGNDQYLHVYQYTIDG